ncbi:P-loop containing nucleoside triphosphate hydrolase protein [Dichomitus squalens]|nr:P-loop containing nucleoside triphosphate hydrolase protein [Dichomitus squalens]
MEDLYTALKNFLPVGVITLRIGSPILGFSGRHQDSETAEDGWTPFPQSFRAADIVDGEGFLETLEALDFLVRHRFVAATYLVHDAQAQLFVRVYLIPWDLPGSSGKLRRRDEDTVLRPGRRRLKDLFPRIKQDRSLWDGHPASSSTPIFFWPKNADNRSLLDIYNDLPSPASEDLVGELPGLRSTLYPYQRRTVSTMMARETRADTIADPLYLALHGMDGRVFYLQPATFEIVTELPRLSPVPGGILCEELGTGKTVMMLSLILATLDDLSSPEATYHEERVPMTPLAIRHFQTPSATAERKKLPKKGKAYRDVGVPSLTEIMLHQLRVCPNSLRLRNQQDVLEQRNLWEPLRANVPFYLHTEPRRDDVGWYQARSGSVSSPKVMYLTTATLVVVPDNLHMQWASEILKHCTDFLRVLVVKNKEELPDAPVLATDYDIILMSHSRFSKEARKKATEELYTMQPCQCKTLRNARVPRCKCSRLENVSPLLQIRWKRLVVDEGHNAAEKRTDYAIFTKLLSVERRWIVTGTPTTNLLGLNFGSGDELQYPDDDDEEEEESSASSDDSNEQRKWHRSEREDFRKLGTMFADFLLMNPFASNSKTFSTLVTDPIFEPEGPFPGDIQVLTQVMASVMVRHRIEDVEQDVRLPFLEHETILLDMDPYAVKTYNLIQATIAVNAVDSERRDQDYLFHPRNAVHLRHLVANISHVMFWHVVDEDLAERLTNAERCLKTLERRNGSSADFTLIKDSIQHLRSAMSDPIWLALQAHYHCFHRVDKLSREIFNGWSMFSEAGRQACDPPLLPPMALMKIRAFLTQHPLKKVRDIVAMGQHVIEEERRWKEFEALHNQLKKKTSKDKRERRRKEDAANDSLTSMKREAKEKKLEEVRLEYQAAAARLTASATGEEVAPLRPDSSQRTVASTLLRLSPMADVRIGNSTSTKLDYILSEVLTYGADEKFLIFSEFPATLSFIAEALDLVRVKYLEFSGKLKREHRQTIITTFETSDLYRVFLMELKHGARGLNLVSASRVIFCEPVWKADVESQAIKRVHRIGQSRRVMVKTLAIRHTAEEVIVARSKALKESKQEFTKEVTDDRTIRDFIEHPTFLPIPIADQVVKLDVPLFEFAPPPSMLPRDNTKSSSPQPSGVRVVEAKKVPSIPRRRVAVHVEISTQPPRKKQKRVAFAN